MKVFENVVVVCLGRWAWRILPKMPSRIRFRRPHRRHYQWYPISMLPRYWRRTEIHTLRFDETMLSERNTLRCVQLPRTPIPLFAAYSLVLRIAKNT